MFVYRSERDHQELDVINVASALIEFSEETTSMIRVCCLFNSSAVSIGYVHYILYSIVVILRKFFSFYLCLPEPLKVLTLCSLLGFHVIMVKCQCCGAVGWVTGRASGP